MAEFVDMTMVDVEEE